MTVLTETALPESDMITSPEDRIGAVLELLEPTFVLANLFPDRLLKPATVDASYEMWDIVILAHSRARNAYSWDMLGRKLQNMPETSFRRHLGELRKGVEGWRSNGTIT